MKTYAIADVHGRADLLGALLGNIAAANAQSSTDYRIVFLGDIIDRGPDSKNAMDLVVAELARCADSRLILGNHEEFLLYFLDLPEKRDLVFDHWMRNGGLACAASYGLDTSRPYHDIREAHRDLFELLERHPEHLAVLRSAVPMVVDTGHIFVHAGLRPGIPLPDQTTKDLRTIRAPFLESDYDFDRVVVHGHTISKSGRPEIYSNRIALDCGAEHSGLLAAIEIAYGRPLRYFAAQKTDRLDVVEVEPVMFCTPRPHSLLDVPP
ncbi:metallophosphoesterase [Rhizobium leguminosarum bv. trifolii WSM1325]|uniref:Metallophosphoesterase n=1 Tax=Rhizobium leguminosarum bv. trifolii (strain WSM1325) TaxID=395491 RepID=C6AVQ9_RHILS|nr:metallophosphoesterase [Rhizobium leguminosarum]ACS55870.1 metallophosphoesterase [Rhizobium leguminosarum bv. trifolii WSM1325]